MLASWSSGKLLIHSQKNTVHSKNCGKAYPFHWRIAAPSTFQTFGTKIQIRRSRARYFFVKYFHIVFLFLRFGLKRFTTDAFQSTKREKFDALLYVSNTFSLDSSETLCLCLFANSFGACFLKIRWNAEKTVEAVVCFNGFFLSLALCKNIIALVVTTSAYLIRVRKLYFVSFHTYCSCKVILQSCRAETRFAFHGLCRAQVDKLSCSLLRTHVLRNN